MSGLAAGRAVVFLPGHDRALEMRRALLHCGERMYEITAIALGERSWPGARMMRELGEVDVIVTVPGAVGHASEPGTEVAGAGRTVIRTPARAMRLRRIADLVDSGLSDEEIVRQLRRERHEWRRPDAA